MITARPFCEHQRCVVRALAGACPRGQYHDEPAKQRPHAQISRQAAKVSSVVWRTRQADAKSCAGSESQQPRYENNIQKLRQRKPLFWLRCRTLVYKKKGSETSAISSTSGPAFMQNWINVMRWCPLFYAACRSDGQFRLAAKQARKIKSCPGAASQNQH